ncbi:hypothetical protein T05_9378 [Trichinella murrelli]|uniref:Uncharacterized protein n=1 Tax=Trichinella murrelli TaxID=144512 RepID=A0A0V0T4H7_9BILA|nr:hypothetical protein T05_9378 [Trichinella murrelli]
MNEIAACFGNYPLLKMFFYKDSITSQRITSINTSSQSTTTSCRSVWRRFINVQDNTTQYLERVWFDYCSVHVFTVISHVSQQFRFLVFFIVTQWVVSVQWNYFYELEYLSLMVVRVSLNGLKRCTKICK